MNPKNTKVFKIFYWFVAASFLIPLVFTRSFSSSVVPKTLCFEFLVELILPFYLYLCLKYFSFRHLKNPLIYASAVFLAVSFISGLAGVDFLHSFWGSLERMSGLYLSLHMFLWLAYLVLLFKIVPEQFEFFAKLLVGMAVFTSLWGILQYFGVGRLNINFTDRSTGLFDNPIFFGAYLVIPLCLCLYFAQKSKPKQYWYLGFGLLIFLAILATKSAGTFVGLAIGLAVGTMVYFFDRQDWKRTGAVVSILVILGLTGLLVITKVPSLKSKFEGPDAKSRMVEWGIALRGFREKPILGVGPENYSYISQKYNNPKIYSYSTDASFDKPHNYYLEILTTTGVLGLLAFLAALWFVVWGIWKLFQAGKLTKWQTAVLFGGVTAYLGQNFFAFDVIAGLLTFVFLYPLAVLGFETGENRVVGKDWAAKLSFVAAAIPLFALFGINLNLAKADLYLTSALKSSQVDPAMSESYYESLGKLPFYTDRSRTATEHSNFAISLPQQIETKVTLEQARTWTDAAIAENEEVVARKPRYLDNYLSLASLYLVKSQLSGSLDPRLFTVCNQADAIAPNRIEADLVLATAYAYANNGVQAQQIENRLMQLAPADENVAWQQVFIYSLTGKPRLVLDEIKKIISQNLDNTAIAQLDKLATFYVTYFNYPVAEAIYNEGLQVSPYNAYLVKQLAYVYFKANDISNAVQLVNTFKAKYPQFYRASDFSFLNQ